MAMAVVGQTLTLTIGRTVGLDIVATATLPAGGGGGGGGGLLTTAVTVSATSNSSLRHRCTDVADIRADFNRLAERLVGPHGKPLSLINRGGSFTIEARQHQLVERLYSYPSEVR